MKHKLLLTIIALFAMQASKAQLETSFVAEDFTTADGEAKTAGTVVAESGSVKWTLAGDDTFKKVSMYAGTDPANTVIIGNTTFEMARGIQGSLNGRDLGAEGKAHPGIQGSEQKLTVSADGMMYVFIKGMSNKGYYVYEGDLPSNTGFPVAYTMVACPVDGSGVYSYKLAEDNQGFGWADMTNTDYWASEGKINSPSAMPGSTWTQGNALSVLVFPVYSEAADYYVWAVGSKIVMNGYAFDKGAPDAQPMAFSKAGEGEIIPVDPIATDPTPTDPTPTDPTPTDPTPVNPGADATLEGGFVPVDFITSDYDGEAKTAGTVVAESRSVKWTLAGDDTFKSVAIAGEYDPANAVVIGNSTFYMFPGIQGSANGKDIGSAYPGIQGSEQKLTVSADGMMYVFIKGSYNKGYYVYEGSLPDNTGFPVAYQMTCNPFDYSGIYSYKLADDGQGYGWADQTDANYWASVGTILKPSAMPGSTWQAGTALCVIAFPAYEGQEYYVWGSGTKLIMDGFVFDKGATSAQEISFAKVDEGEITPIDPPTPIDPDYNENSMYIADGISFNKNEENILPISMKNSKDIAGCQFDIVLPRGMYLSGASINGNRSNSHSVSYNTLSDGSIRFVVVSMQNDAFYDNDGELVNLYIKLADNIKSGTQSISLKNVEMTTRSYETLKPADQRFTIEVKDNMMGDVNSDKQIDVTDVVLIIDYILGKNPYNFNEAAADIDQNGSINVTDVVMVIDMILGNTNANGTMSLNNKQEVVGAISLPADLNLVNGQSNVVPVSLYNPTAYTAFQMDVTLPAGVSLKKAALTGRASDSHAVSFSKIADGSYRIVGVSLNNDAFNGIDGELLNLTLDCTDQAAVANVSIDNILFVTKNGTQHELNAIDAIGNTTGINSINGVKIDAKSEIYDLQGRKAPDLSKKNSIYIIDGKSYTF